MRPTLPLALTLGLAAQAFAQAANPPATTTEESSLGADAAQTAPEPAAPPPAGFKIRRIDFGLESAETDTDSSRFREYRAVPTGVFIPFVQFKGNERFWYDVVGENVLQSDARYRALLKPGSFAIKAEYQKIPHRFGNNGRTLLEETATGVLSLSDALQQSHQSAIERQFATSRPGVNFAFLNALLAPSLAVANTIDLALLRERGQVEVRLTRDKPLDVRLNVFQEKRRGTRAAGTSFGFGNVVETPEPIDYLTREAGITAEWTRSWGLLRGSLRYNDFRNRILTETFDNPFRVTDATDASAYTAPGATSIGGPAVGRLSLPPESKSLTGSLGFLVKFGGNSRFSTDATLGEWTQDDPFMPFTSNTAITSPLNASDIATLPARSLDGKIRTFSLSSAVTSRPVDHLSLAARFRRYDLSNETPRIEFPGYVRFDGVWEDIPRVSVPYGYTTDALTLSASYNLGSVNLEGGYKLDRWDRTFRETRETTQNVGYLKADVRAKDWLLLRATFETGRRTFDEYDTGRSEHASYAEPEDLAQLPELRRFDQAEKDVDRYGAYLQLSPGGGEVMVTLSYLKGKDDYAGGAVGLGYGLQTAESEAVTAEVDYSPSDRLSLHGFYTRENLATFLRGRQSGATPSTRTIDDWTSDVDDKVNSFGGGATLGLVRDKLDLRLFGSYQKLDGNNDLTSPPGGTPDVAFGIPVFDDTKLYSLSGELSYRATQEVTLALGGWYEDYVLRDSNTSDITGGLRLPNYGPGSLFLAADDSDYKAHVLYVRLSYLW